MPYLLTSTETRFTWVQDAKPDSLDGYESVTYFDTVQDAETAQYLIAKTRRDTAAAATAELRGETIDNLVKRIDELVEKSDALQAICNRQAMTISSLKLSLEGARNIIQHAFDATARDLVIESTHRERNELYRSIARGMDQWLQFNHESQDMAEIPF